MPRGVLLLLAVACEGGMALIALIAGWLLAIPIWRSVLPDATDLGWGAVYTLPMVAGLLVIVHWPIGPLKGLKSLCDEMIVPLFKPLGIEDLFFISALAGLGEEMLFRGILQPGLQSFVGPWPGLVVASLLFGLAHSVSFAYLVLASGLGLYLGWVRDVHDGLAVPIVTHALYDFLALCYLTRGQPRPIQGSNRPGAIGAYSEDEDARPLE